ncbi:hypothetical protein ISS07_06415 [Candidatus Woesearchaeota archaeon]|nr:hypothetical protein [Candidatus Woesearchaeota archaeon]
MSIDNLVKDIEVWSNNQGMFLGVELTGSKTKESVTKEIFQELTNMYSRFGATLKKKPAEKGEKYHIKNGIGTYRGTIIIEPKGSYSNHPSRDKKRMDNHDFPTNQHPRPRHFQTYFIKVPRMADESKRREHLNLIKDYLERGPIAIDSYKYTQGLRKNMG